MPSKLQMYEQMADQTAKQVTGSFGEWTAFLETMGRLYKYPFHEQLMIFAQKPNATACADYDLWNKQMGRYVRRGTKGIALIDTSGDNPKLKYVFDVSDTGTRANSRRLNLWEYRDEHQDAVTASLENRFGVSGEKGLADQLEQIAGKLVTEYWNDNRRDILGILEDSFLEEYDDYNVEMAFRNAAAVSTTYTLMSRCGLNPGDYFEHEDFLSVFDFNTRDTIAVLGSAVSNSSEQILRQIAITVKNYEREASLQKQAERMQNDSKTRDVYVDYRKSGCSKRYLEEHEPDIIIHKAAKKAFDELGLKKLPTIKSLQVEFAEKLTMKKEAYAELKRVRDELRDLAVHTANYEELRDLEEREKRKEKEHGRE